MADEKEESTEGGKETKKKKGKLILIIIPLVVILLGGGGFFAYKTFLAPSGGDDEHAASEDDGHGKHGAKKHAKKKSKHKGGHGGGDEESSGEGPEFFNLAPFVVNLQDNIGTRYLKLTVKLELAEPGTDGELKGQLPRIRDALIILLSSKNYSEIGTVEGKYRLRDEIVKRINRILKEASVRGAYFTDFVIQ
ncbi:MAG: flagellar basal body-associated protein FliL [Thermodesulfobacteriota bacterium]